MVLGCVVVRRWYGVVKVLAVPMSTYHLHPSIFGCCLHSCLRWLAVELAVEGHWQSSGSHSAVRASQASQCLGPLGHETAEYASWHHSMPPRSYLCRMTGDVEVALLINTTCGKRGYGYLTFVPFSNRCCPMDWDAWVSRKH